MYPLIILVERKKSHKFQFQICFHKCKTQQPSDKELIMKNWAYLNISEWQCKFWFSCCGFFSTWFFFWQFLGQSSRPYTENMLFIAFTWHWFKRGIMFYITVVNQILIIHDCMFIDIFMDMYVIIYVNDVYIQKYDMFLI